MNLLFRHCFMDGSDGAAAHLLRRASRDTRGGVLITFAFVFPVLLLVIGGAIDYGFMFARKTALQGATDAGALAATRELLLANAGKDEVEAVAKASVIGNLGKDSEGVSIAMQIDLNARSVTVIATQTPGLYLLDGLLGLEAFDISASATARVAGQMPICVLALETSDVGVWLQSDSRLTGNKCAVYSNSTSSKGIGTKGQGTLLTSQLTCTAGGFSGEDYTYNPVPLTDCPPIDDPLAGRAPPSVGPCDHDALVIHDVDSRTLSPGVYCGGLTITAEANIKLRPGIYVIKDGPLIVDGEIEFTGEHVGFYLLGDLSTFSFSKNVIMNLSAPIDGPMAGILFFEDRNAPLLRSHAIKSDYARSLTGTIYLPQGLFKVDASRKVAAESAYTVVIARELKLYSGPHLILNSDYQATDVPVPSELNGMSSPGEEIVLVQ